MTRPASPEQEAVVAHVRRSWAALRARRAGDHASGMWPRNLVVEATAGSGKTSILEYICEAIPDARVDVVAFNTRNAREAGRRLPSNASSVTLHAACKRAWEAHWGYRFVEGGGEGAGELARDKSGRIVRALKEQGRISRYLPAAKVCRLVSAAKSVGLVPRLGPGEPGYPGPQGGSGAGGHDNALRWRLAEVCPSQPLRLAPLVEDKDEVWYALMEHHEVEHPDRGELVAAARAALVLSVQSGAHVIDFDDMCYLAALGGVQFPARDVVAVDELQDLDAMQRLVVRGMSRNAIFVGVGDSFQCVYAWRGADIDGINTMVADLDCDTLPLSVTWRCPSAHVRLAQEVCPSIRARDGAPEGEVLTLDRPRPDLFLPGDAVLARTNAALLKVAYWLLRARVPVRVLGHDFGRGLAALARSVAQRGGATADDVARELRRRQRALLRRSASEDDPPEAAQRLGECAEVLEILRDRVEERRACALTLTTGAASEPEEEGRDLIGRAVDPYQPATLDEVLAEAEEVLGGGGADAEPTRDPDTVTLCTIHRAKGGEWDRVWWADADEVAPRPRMPEWRRRETLNLRFIAMTRSREFLGFFSTRDL